LGAARRAIWTRWRERSRLDFRGEFYTHTLMTPFFAPRTTQPSPPIYLAGVGARMVEMVGEVADGFLVHPFHSRSFLDAETLPALRRGIERAGRKSEDVVISAQTVVALGADDEQVERARRKARGQLSFYGSTPAYKGVLEHHGRPELQPELNRLSKQGQWAAMAELVDDALFDALAVSGTPAQVAARLAARNTFADRTTLMLYDEAGPGAVEDVVRSLRDA
jgi:probable F420-dependent oxidoreductase